MWTNKRIEKLLAVFAQYNIDALLITKDVNIQYLTGFPAAESWLLISFKRHFYITDSRYILEARRGLKGITVVKFTKSIAETLFKIAQSHQVKRIGFDEHYLNVFQYKGIEKKCPKGIRLLPTNGIIESFREIKEDHEVSEIRDALKIHAQALKFLKKIIRPGISEKEIFLKLERFVWSKKATFSFVPIIASGSNSCYPHAKITEREIRRNDLVLIDIGININGYKSDLTRVFFLGKIPKLIQEVYECVRQAQLIAIENIRAGIQASKIDYLARNYLGKKRLAKYFGHALGHGVGLEIHEAPCLSQKESAVLKEGMVITVEPAVYIPHKFGIRIEDMILVTKEGKEILSDDIN